MQAQIVTLGQNMLVIWVEESGVAFQDRKPPLCHCKEITTKKITFFPPWFYHKLVFDKNNLKNTKS
jgi:hypothetical protein